MDLVEARKTFRDARVAHVATVLTTGHPHVVPLWFVWLDDAIYASSRRDSQVRRNVTRDPRVAVQIDIGRTWTEQAGVLLHGAAELLGPEHPSAKHALSAWFDKYREELAGRGFAAYSEEVRHPMLLRVPADRFSTWIHAMGTGR
jgi:nitroimidazol reductase NimA-like FMN-containing flavoprotein (pyridoxamine 5'-phosphate oxidase superfamily)